MDWNVRGIDIVKDLGWLNVCQRRDYFTAITVYLLAGLQPSYITDLFTLSRDIANRIIRSCCTNKLFLPKANKSDFNCSLQYSGAIIWNNVQDIIRNIDTFNVFKQTLKQFLKKLGIMLLYIFAILYLFFHNYTLLCMLHRGLVSNNYVKD